MRIHVADHPLITHKLTILRDQNTDSPTFRKLADELVSMLAVEATRNIRVETVDVVTPVAPTKGKRLSNPQALIVPILRAGLGMLDGMSRLVPSAEIGFLGMVRNEETLEATTYADRLPKNLTGRQVYLLDPMLATGGSLASAIHLMLQRGASEVSALCLIAAPEGLKKLEEHFGNHDNVTILCAGLDEKLNEKGYIVPGLGDAGDRLYGSAE
jgi:uracil phosphoribosyltransferase